MPSLPQSLIVRALVLWVSWAERWGQAKNEAPINHEDLVRNLLQHLDMHKSKGPGGIHPRVLRELMEELPEPPSIIYQQSWLTGGSQLTASWWMWYPHQKMFFLVVQKYAQAHSTAVFFSSFSVTGWLLEPAVSFEKPVMIYDYE